MYLTFEFAATSFVHFVKVKFIHFYKLLIQVSFF
jgi:hypothetical protein